MIDLKRRAELSRELKRVVLALCDEYESNTIQIRINANREEGKVSIEFVDTVKL